MAGKGLIAKFATVGAASMASRVLGLAREALMAAALGAGPVADVFYTCFRFPNLFRRLFAEGAFNIAFVPLFAKELGSGAKIRPAGVFGSRLLADCFYNHCDCGNAGARRNRRCTGLYRHAGKI